MRLSWLRSEEGGVLLWAVGALAVGAMATLAAASVAQLVGAQRELEAAADIAALAAANELSVLEFNDSGKFSDVQVDPVAARAAARSALSAGGFAVRIIRIGLGDQSVEVEVAREWVPGFGLGGLTLRAERKVDLVLG